MRKQNRKEIHKHTYLHGYIIYTITLALFIIQHILNIFCKYLFFYIYKFAKKIIRKTIFIYAIFQCKEKMKMILWCLFYGYSKRILRNQTITHTHTQKLKKRHDI
jgi:hypothetical protein